MHILIQLFNLFVCFQLISTFPQELSPESHIESKLQEVLPTYDPKLQKFKLKFRSFLDPKEGVKIIRLQDYSNYSIKIDLRDEANFPALTCKTVLATCNVQLIPPEGYGIVVIIQRLNIRVRSDYSKLFRMAKGYYETRFADADKPDGFQCRDYLQFSEDDDTHSTHSKKNCGELNPIYTGESEIFVGSHYYISESNNNVTIKLHHASDQYMDTLYGNTWNDSKKRSSTGFLTYTSQSQLGGELLVSAYSLKDNTMPMPEISTTTAKPVKSFWNWSSFENAGDRDETSTQPTIYHYSYFNVPKNSSSSSSSPTRLLMVVILIIVIVVLSILAVIRKKIRDADFEERNMNAQTDFRRSTASDRFASPSQLLASHTNSADNRTVSNHWGQRLIRNQNGGVSVHTIVAIPPPSPPPVYPGDANLPSYESLFSKNNQVPTGTGGANETANRSNIPS